MLTQIVRHTPLWVFILFFVLLGLGYAASRTRTVSRRRVAILPAALILFSAYGVVSGFGYRPAGIVAWFAGIGLASLLNHEIFRLPRGAGYSEATRSFALPGSWIPLTLMLTIFFAKYAVAVALALEPALIGTTGFVTGMCLLYGLLSGMFFASALTLWRLMRETVSAPRLATDGKAARGGTAT
jgi:Family of unknown function (DUF6622)